MSKATNTKLMDTAPGGENTQYEGAKVTIDQTKDQSSESTSQFDTTKSPSEATTQAEEKKAERGERTAENIRFGESISEHGFGGETVGNSGGVSDGERSKDEEEGESVRKAMGYGGGSGVGA